MGDHLFWLATMRPTLTLIISRALIPLLLVGFFLAQLWHSQEGQLTRWKGGGFGMYTDIHWSSNQVWVGSREHWFSGDTLTELLGHENQRYLGRVQRNPSEENMRQLADLIMERGALEECFLQVWRPEIDEECTTYGRVLVSEMYYRP